MASLFSTLATTAGQWNHPSPNCATLDTTIGHGAATIRTNAAAALAISAAHSPPQWPFSSPPIVSGSTLDTTLSTSFPANLHNATPCDNLVHLMVGDDLNTAVGMALDADTFGRTANLAFFAQDYILGDNGYTHAGAAVTNFAINAAGVCSRQC